MSKTDRRNFMKKGGAMLAAQLIIPGLVASVFADDDISQDQWRFCDKCEGLFYNGFPTKGTCPAGEAHNAQGYNFDLPHGNNLVETAKAQVSWRYCGKCFSMFFDGFPDKGKCASGAGHVAQGYKFRLPHDISGDGNNQSSWRYCQKCHVMFYDGYAGKGRCPAGSGHSAYGYMFVLPHGNPADISIKSNVTTDGWAPIGGWVQVDAHSNGDYSFGGHIHNSGAVNIRYTLAATLVTPTGQCFGFARNNHRVDGTETVLDRKRDDNWNAAANDIEIKRNWDQVSRSQLYWRLVASDTIGERLETLLENIAKEGLNRLRQTVEAQPGAPLMKFYLKLLQSI
jgi:hypothetical protein